jgi:hypothetical protein
MRPSPAPAAPAGVAGAAVAGALAAGLRDFAASWPFGLTARGVDFYKEREYLADLGQRSSSFSFGRTSRKNDTPEIVIMVIGESSRYDRWGINGYGATPPAAQAGSQPGHAAGRDHGGVGHAAVGAGHHLAQAGHKA